jgi:hypothetical protein
VPSLLTVAGSLLLRKVPEPTVVVKLDALAPPPAFKPA